MIAKIKAKMLNVNYALAELCKAIKEADLIGAPTIFLSTGDRLTSGEIRHIEVKNGELLVRLRVDRTKALQAVPLTSLRTIHGLAADEEA